MNSTEDDTWFLFICLFFTKEIPAEPLVPAAVSFLRDKANASNTFHIFNCGYFSDSTWCWYITVTVDPNVGGVTELELWSLKIIL